MTVKASRKRARGPAGPIEREEKVDQGRGRGGVNVKVSRKRARGTAGPK